MTCIQKHDRSSCR